MDIEFVSMILSKKKSIMIGNFLNKENAMDVKVKDDELFIAINMNSEGVYSRSGKMILIASAHGWTPIGTNDDGRVVKLSLNCGYSAYN
tara:strand:- start:130 stop:396 length:267 start_codon:yes stop_codon:yes gene_type:complete